MMMPCNASFAIAIGSVTRRLRAMGIRDKPTAPASPWQMALPNG